MKDQNKQKGSTAKTRSGTKKKLSCEKHSNHAGNSKKSKTPLTYEKWVSSAISGGVKGIRREYVDSVRSYAPVGSQKAWNSEKNCIKNRYDDIRLLDKTRVVLKDTPDNNDYINASYVIAGDTTFICTQGPMENTIQDFWIMSVQEQVKVILQLCKYNENGREQCAEYFKDEETWVKYGSVRVRTLEKSINVAHLKKVTRTLLQVEYKGKRIEVTHILYAGWPDQSVAESTSICREVRRLVLGLSQQKPVIVHCSAGVGRTGTFVTLEMAISLLKKKEFVPMVEIAKRVRNQRIGAIQNDQQYLFIYRMILEILIYEDLLSRTEQIVNFIKDYNDLIRRKCNERARKFMKKSKEKAIAS
ncbi:unnamed protein product [Thelazia callipaeda]|uniref:Protein-tyrosine phosphatase n=1 Tax=Thelazia callipaeda TaxID=103827 RepID=A0A0N5CXM6_THECL|nr:unnamed protein product [Thelazia callipaeda]